MALVPDSTLSLDSLIDRLVERRHALTHAQRERLRNGLSLGIPEPPINEPDDAPVNTLAMVRGNLRALNRLTTEALASRDAETADKHIRTSSSLLKTLLTIEEGAKKQDQLQKAIDKVVELMGKIDPDQAASFLDELESTLF